MATDEMKKALEIIKESVKPYKKTRKGASIQIPKSVKNVLVSAWKVADKKAITIKVKELNDAIGFSGDLERERASTIKQKLNSQFDDLSNGKQYHMGYSETEERYIFDIVDVKEDSKKD